MVGSNLWDIKVYYYRDISIQSIEDIPNYNQQMAKYTG